MNRQQTNKRFVLILTLCTIILSFTLISCIDFRKPQDDISYVIIDLECETDTIIINENSGYGDVPRIYPIKEKYVNGQKTEVIKDLSPLSFSEYEFEESQYCYYENGRMYPKDSTQVEWKEKVMLYLLNGNDIDYNISFEFTVTKNPIPAESIALRLLYENAVLQAEQSIFLQADYNPSNTSYLETIWIAEFVEKDGQRITTNLDEYITFSFGGIDNNTENTTSLKITNLQAGDKVSVIARSKRDEGIISNPLEIPVV